MDLAQLQETPGVQPHDLAAAAGRKILRYHFAKMKAHEPGVRLGEDIEALHDMRVAFRRMRVAHSVFKPYFEAGALKPFRKALRATGRALGPLRDLDVFLEKLHPYLAALPPQGRSDMQPLLDFAAQEQGIRRAHALTHLQGLKYQRFLVDFDRFLTVADPAAEKDASHTVRMVVPQLIHARLDRVLAFAPKLENPTANDLHSLRIAFKRLRYTIEFFSEVLGPEYASLIDQLKGIQDHLGDLNDAAVAAQTLEAFLEAQASPSVEDYLHIKREERRQLVQTFPAVWTAFNRPEFHNSLAAAIAVL